MLPEESFYKPAFTRLLKDALNGFINSKENETNFT